MAFHSIRITRSERVYTCPVCGARTNAVLEGGAWGCQAIPCPNATACWHHEIDARMRWLRLPHPPHVRARIEEEIVACRAQHAADIRHDVAAVEYHLDSCGVTTLHDTFARPSDTCLHRLLLFRNADNRHALIATHCPV